jgi:hypothetical protein
MVSPVTHARWLVLLKFYRFGPNPVADKQNGDLRRLRDWHCCAAMVSLAPMLSVIIPTQDCEEGLARTLASLVPAAASGVIREVVIADGGSTDGTEKVADIAGCTFVRAGRGWGERVAAGVAAARRAPWVLILPPHVLLEADWSRAVAAFVERAERSGQGDRLAATFRLECDAFGFQARLAEGRAALSSRLFGRPHPAQGLVLSRRHFDRIRRAGRLDEHHDLVRRIGRRALYTLRVRAVVFQPSADPLEAAAAGSRDALAPARWSGTSAAE